MNFSIVLFLNNLTQVYPWIGSIAALISGPISYVLFPAFFIIYIVLKNKNHMYWFSLIFLSTFLSWFVAVILKHVFRITRPFLAHTSIHPLTTPPGFSFPSEHASVYGALTYLAWQFDYRLGIITTIIAVCVIFSRLFVGVHYPLDVLVGYILGFSITLCITYFFKKYL